MKHKFLLLFALVSLWMPTRLSAQMPVIFETDMGNDVDDAWALDMLYKYVDDKRVNLMAIMLNKEGDGPVHYIDALNTWYGYPRIPIGRSLRTAKSIATKKSYADSISQRTDERGRLLYKRSIKRYDKLPDAVTLYRRLLSKAKDNSVTIISVGFSTNLAALLDTQADKYSPLSGRELVERKVSRLIVMAGHMTKQFAEYNVKNDIPACQRVYHEWPTPIITTSLEVGSNIKYPAQSVRDDFTWTKHHPVVESIHVYLGTLRDHPTWDMTAVLYALEGEADLFSMSPAGQVRVTDEGYTIFTPTPEGKHFYLICDAAQRQRVLDAMRQLVVRQPKHFRPKK